jgi:hypothetical protein
VPASLAIQAQEELNNINHKSENTAQLASWDFSTDESNDLPTLELQPFYSEMKSDKVHIEEVIKERIETRRQSFIPSTELNKALSSSPQKGVERGIVRSKSENFSLGTLRRMDSSCQKIAQTPKVVEIGGDFSEFLDLDEEEES